MDVRIFCLLFFMTSIPLTIQSKGAYKLLDFSHMSARGAYYSLLDEASRRGIHVRNNNTEDLIKALQKKGFEIIMPTGRGRIE